MAILSKDHQAHRTRGTRNPTARGLPYVDQKTVMRGVKNATLNDIYIHQNYFKKSRTCIQVQSRKMKYYRRISDMNATEEHETPR